MPSDISLEDLFEELNSISLRFLSYKPRTEYEVSQRLSKELLKETSLSSGEKEGLIERVLHHLRGLNLIDDLEYANSYIEEQKKKSVPKGPQYIRQFLRKKGIPKEMIEKSLIITYSAEDEADSIQKVLKKRSKQDPAKMIAYLRQRGFSYNVIN
ncbi:MAG TPA: hypothetical protein ENN92_01660, partial [candidate division WWE3 bacterium]|nr:hypothetical protein [candidate division WWE3 bacterium]